MKVLAISSSRVGNGGFLENAISLVQDFIGSKALKIAFIPFASVQKNYEEYGSMVKQAFASLPYSIYTVIPDKAKSVIEDADAIMVGGGNTFKLLHDIYQYDLFERIQSKVKSGTPYIGWSAGANIAGRTLSTTNDMPIIQPKSFNSFAFFPFQINPHYINQTVQGHNGETRDQRLEEFVVLNPGVPVVGLPEGTALQLQNRILHFIGDKEGVLFQFDTNQSPQKIIIRNGAEISWLI
jgi:dipeptidase E